MKKKTISSAMLTVLLSSTMLPTITAAQEIEPSEGIQSTSGEVRNLELTEKKLVAEGEIDLLPGLDSEEKETYKKRVKDASTKEEIDAAVSDAETASKFNVRKMVVTEELQATKALGINDIQYTKLEAQLNQATNIEELEAVQANIATEVVLIPKRLEADFKIDEMSGLGKTEKDTYKEQIAVATDAETIALIVNNANTENKFNESKAAVKLELDAAKLVIGEVQYNLLNEALQEAKTEAEVQAVSQNIKNQVNLAPKKIAANLEIDSILALNKTEKEQFKNDVALANSEEEINNAVQAAKLLPYQKAAKLEISAMEKVGALDADQVADFNQRIEAATSKEDIDAILQDARQDLVEDVKEKIEIEKLRLEFDAKKIEAKAELDLMLGLKENQREFFRTQIDALNSSDIKSKDDFNSKVTELDTILNNAKEIEKLTLEFDAKKIEAKAELDLMLGLKDEQRESFKTQIDALNSSDIKTKDDFDIKVTELGTILNNAKEQERQNFLDWTALEKLIAQTNNKDQANYMPGNWVKFELALNNAKSVLATKDTDKVATQEEINQAFASLFDANEALVPIASTQAIMNLNHSIKVARDRKEKLYTKESWVSMQKVLKEAESMSAEIDANLDAYARNLPRMYSDQEVRDMTKKLNSSLLSLKLVSGLPPKVEVPKAPKPSNFKPTTKPAAKPAAKPASPSASAPKAAASSLPKTGEVTHSLMSAGLLALGMAGYFYMSRKRLEVSGDITDF